MDTLRLLGEIAGIVVTLIGLLKLFILPVRNFIKKSNENDEQLTKAVESLGKQIEAVDKKTDNNERDRIRREIFNYGNMARKGEVISYEEFRSLQMDFEKYVSELKGNGIAKDEYFFIVDYFNKSGAKID